MIRVTTMLLSRIAVFALSLVAIVSAQAAEPGAEAPSAPTSIKTSKGICKAGFDTRIGPVTLEWDIYFNDNKPIAVVTINKPCKGAVSARFTARSSADDGDEYIVGGIDARCIGDGGHANGCKKGDTASGQPDHFYFAIGPDAHATYSIDAVFENMNPGKWRFKVRMGGPNNVDVYSRSLAVEAFRGG